MIGKESLREVLRDRRWSLSARDRQESSRIICRSLAELVSRNERVMVYCAKEPEVETNSFIRYLLGAGIPVIVPIIQQEDVSLRLSYLQRSECLVPSTFHVPEPVGSEIPANPADVTSAIIPMLGFDRNGGRLGYGAGYYDRFLSQNQHIRTIGIAFSCQEVHQIPLDTNDVLMDLVVTESGIFSSSPERG